jgi:hypothetical protein
VSTDSKGCTSVEGRLHGEDLETGQDLARWAWVWEEHDSGREMGSGTDSEHR